MNSKISANNPFIDLANSLRAFLLITPYLLIVLTYIQISLSFGKLEQLGKLVIERLGLVLENVLITQMSHGQPLPPAEQQGQGLPGIRDTSGRPPPSNASGTDWVTHEPSF